LSGRAAGHLLYLLSGATPAPEVTATTERRIEGVKTRRSRRLDREDVTTWRGIPSTTVPRTLVDLAASKLESRFLEHLRTADLDLPETNRPAGGRRVDCRWPEYRLTVELDSYRYHHSRHAWEQDRLRAREARARGDKFRPYTYGDVFEDDRFMLRELHELLDG
jgi:hypothetical protein